MIELGDFSIEKHFLYPFLNPKSVCIYGANNEFLSTMGAMQLRNIIFGGFPKDKIFPIHPRLSKIQGLKAFKNVIDLPEIPDLALIILRPDTVPQVLEECGQKGVKRAIITSGGFREVGNTDLNLKLAQIANKHQMRFIGPNCLGVYNAWYRYPEFKKIGFNTMWIYATPERGNISIIAQSGTVASHIFWMCREKGVKIGKSISIGNEDNIDTVDFLDFFRNDPQTSVIGIYIEEIKRGKEFIELARQIIPNKPVIGIYAGGTEAATRSIRGHTGAIAGNDKIFDSVFQDTGVISTISIKDWMYYLRTFSNGVIPHGNRLGIITDSGGCGAMMAKAAEKLGLQVPEFSDELKLKLKNYVPEVANIDNPLDLTFQFNQYNLYIKIPKLIIKSGEIDGIILYAAFGFEEIIEIIKNSGGKKYDELEISNSMMKNIYLKPIQRLVRKKDTPIFYIGPQGYNNPWVREFLKSDIPIFELWDMPVKCFAVLAQYSEFKKRISNKF